jgi:signal peptidase I
VSTPEPKRPRQPWRENIEAFTVAIVMAVMLKYFAVEAYQIPTGSMQPTLMGQEFRGERATLAGEIKDRILVDKFSFHMRDPERWEVVIFKYPLNRAQNFVKRLVGMPGEHLKIQYGDVWRRENPSAEWKVVRRPAAVQREHWKAIDIGAPKGGASWKRASSEGAAPRIEGRKVSASAPARVEFAAHGGGPIQDTYSHGYPPGMRAELDQLPPHYNSNRNYVGDLRVTGRVRSAEGARVAIVLTEGKRRYRFELPGDRSQPPASIAIDWAPNETLEPRSASAGSPNERSVLRASEWTEFAVENLDDELRLELGGEHLVTLPTQPAADQTSSVAIELVSGSAEFEELQVWRDIHYTGGRNASEWTIPDGHFFMLGDNTQDSSDSREWQLVQLKWSGSPAGETPVAGNFRGGAGPGMYRPDSNPIRERTDDGLVTFFRDVYGELHTFPTETEITLPPGQATVFEPFVPRQLITGRAVAVFWPLSFKYSTYRVKWIR